MWKNFNENFERWLDESPYMTAFCIAAGFSGAVLLTFVFFGILTPLVWGGAFAGFVWYASRNPS